MKIGVLALQGAFIEHEKVLERLGAEPVEVRLPQHLEGLDGLIIPGGIATPADAALMMQLGMDGVFVGSGIFKSGDPAKRARAIVQAVTHYDNPEILAEVSRGLGEAMVGIHVSDIPEAGRLAVRGW